MDIESIVAEYVRSKQAADAMAQRANELKKILVREVSENGEEDNKGNLWSRIGGYSLQYQRRQKSPVYDKSKAEDLLKGVGIWEELKQTTIVEEVPEDVLVGYVFEHPEHEHILREVYEVPEPTWAFMQPQAVEQYDEE
jgi:hypothetical protein